MPTGNQDTKDIKAAYITLKRKRLLFLAVLAFASIVLMLLAVTLGSAEIAAADVIDVIIRKLTWDNDVKSGRNDMIIWKLRMPRILMGVFAGTALGASGAVMQGVLRNPLVDPYILGISSSAGFGASLAIVLGVGFLSGPYLLIGNAFVFSLLSSVLILALSSKKQASPQTMVLVGLACLFFFQALTTLLQYFGDADAVKAAVFWTVGDLGKADWEKIAIVAPLVTIGTALLIWKSNDLNIMNSGDDVAKSLGVNIVFTRIFTLIVCSLMIAGVVSFTGTIGFVGLVAPHLVRLIMGPDNKILIPASALAGTVLLLAADSIARTIMAPVILPVGAVTAFLGVPLFLHLIIKKGASI